MKFYYKNIKIYYKTKGKGQEDCPLLFLHGWEGSTKSFDYFFEKLSKHRFCVNVDFPPFGLSSMPKEELTLADYAEIIKKLIKNLNAKRVDIVAHSFGGRVAIFLASQTNNINKMLLTGCAGLKKRSMLKFFKVQKYRCLKFLSKINIYSKQKLLKYGSEEYKKLNPIMKKTFINIVNFNQISQLKKINVPTLLIWGTLDKETPFYFTKIFKKHIKDCEVIKFKNCSHFAYLEKPNLFLNILLSYFC
ncbi:MAG: alpha/beta hydrolase [Clostridia bacterium]|nr:alpha/beta hydrolase [Clostridia bacterium]